MTETSPIIPVLSTSVGYLTERSEIAAATVQYLLLNPGRTSDTHEDLLISFRGLASRYGHDRDLICNELQKAVPVVLARSFPNDNIECKFEAFDYNEDSTDPRFGVSFNILFHKSDGTVEPAVLSGSFLVGDEYDITVDFN